MKISNILDFFLVKWQHMELEGEHRELKLDVKKKASEGQNRLCHKHPLIDNKFGFMLQYNHSANNE